MQNNKQENNLKEFGNPDKYTDEFNYIIGLLNKTNIDINSFGDRELNKSIHITNNIIKQFIFITHKANDLNDLKTILNNMQHELTKLYEKNIILMDTDTE